MTFITDTIRANGWGTADLDVIARALIEAARREGANHGKAVYMPLTDAEWRQHRTIQNLQFAFSDARIVLSALKRDRAPPLDWVEAIAVVEPENVAPRALIDLTKTDECA